jgi:hypothetical protein
MLDNETHDVKVHKLDIWTGTDKRPDPGYDIVVYYKCDLNNTVWYFESLCWCWSKGDGIFS